MTAPPTQINGLDPISGVADLLTADVPVQDAAGRTYRAPVTMFQDLSALAVQDVSSSVVLAEASIAVRADATSGTLSVTLPDASGASGQFVYIVKFDAGSNHVTATSKGTDTIEGSATKAITTQWGSLLLLARPGGWDVVATEPVGGGSVSWADITDTPTTIAGYGITDAYTETGADAAIAAAVAAGVATAEAYTDAAIAGLSGVYAGIADPAAPVGWALPWGQVTGAPSAANITTGTWTPAEVGTPLQGFNYASFTLIGPGEPNDGSLVILTFSLVYPSDASGCYGTISGLPYPPGGTDTTGFGTVWFLNYDGGDLASDIPDQHPVIIQNDGGGQMSWQANQGFVYPAPTGTALNDAQVVGTVVYLT